VLAEFAAPFADCFVGDDHPGCKPECFNIAVAEAGTVVQPDIMADECIWEAVALIVVTRWCAHTTSVAHEAAAEQAAQHIDNAPNGRANEHSRQILQDQYTVETATNWECKAFASSTIVASSKAQSISWDDGACIRAA
jgi:hypothetical protein